MLRFKDLIRITGVNPVVVNKLGLSTTTHLSADKNSSTRNNVPAMSYAGMMTYRTTQARNTVAIRVKQEQWKILIDHCSRFGEITGIWPYKVGKDLRNTILLEYKDGESVLELLRDTKYFPNTTSFQVPSRFLVFEPRRLEYKTRSVRVHRSPEKGLDIKALSKAKTVSDQMRLLYDQLSLSELGMRQRHLVVRGTEEMLRGVFASCAITPFGSSVTGLGRYNCDLDLQLDVHARGPQHTEYLTGNHLYFATKQTLENERSHHQATLRLVGLLLQTVSPRVRSVQHILNARVPIVKFYNNMTEVDCDLSMDNRSGLDMGIILYNYCQLNPSFTPLIFTVRTWASAQGIHTSGPENGMSSFMMTALVISFLQTKVPEDQKLPPMSVFDTLPEKGRREILRKPKQQNKLSNEALPLEVLLKEFLQFVATFDFENNGISLKDGRILENRKELPFSDCSMYIENPTELEKNVTKNVRDEVRTLLQKLAADALNSFEDTTVKTVQGEQIWGLLNLLVREQEKSLAMLLRDQLNKVAERRHQKSQVSDVKDLDSHLSEGGELDNQSDEVTNIDNPSTEGVEMSQETKSQLPKNIDSASPTLKENLTVAKDVS